MMHDTGRISNLFTSACLTAICRKAPSLCKGEHHACEDSQDRHGLKQAISRELIAGPKRRICAIWWPAISLSPFEPCRRTCTASPEKTWLAHWNLPFPALPSFRRSLCPCSWKSFHLPSGATLSLSKPAAAAYSSPSICTRSLF